MRSDGLVLRFERGTTLLDTPDELELEGATLTTCGECARPPWQVSARYARVSLDEEVRVRGGLVRLFGLPLLPVPRWRVPLTRRSGLLAPDLGWGEDGLRASLPLYLTLGQQADTTLAPEVRTQRGSRLLSEVRWATRAGEGEVDGALGYDWVDQSVRGAASWSQSASQGRLRAATRGQLVSDQTYLADYRDDYLSRSWPWTGARAAVGAGPVELGWVLSQADEERELLGWEQLTAGVYGGGMELPGGVLTQASAVGTAQRLGPWEGGTRWASGSAQAHASRPLWLGPVRLTPAAGGWGSGSVYGEGSTGDPWAASGHTSLEVALPAWRATEGGMERLEPTLRVAGSLYSSTEPHSSVAGGLLWRRTGAQGLVELRPELTWGSGDSGWSLGGDAALSWRGLQGWTRVRASPGRLDSGVAELGTTHGALSVGGGWVYLDEVQLPGEEATALHQARARAAVELPGRLDPLRLSAETRWDLQGSAWLSHVARLQWTHPTGCARVGIVGRLDADRARPDLGIEVGVR